jgi:hypothetical protein
MYITGLVKVEPTFAITVVETSIIFYVNMMAKAKESVPLLQIYVNYIKSLLSHYLDVFISNKLIVTFK